MKTIQKTLVGIFGVLCLLSGQNLKAQTYYAVAEAIERPTLGDNSESRHILTHVFPVKFCKNETVSLDAARSVTSDAVKKIETKFEEEYKYSLGSKDYYIANKTYTKVHIYETQNEATSKMKKIVSDYKTRFEIPVAMIDINLE